MILFPKNLKARVMNKEKSTTKSHNMNRKQNIDGSFNFGLIEIVIGKTI